MELTMTIEIPYTQNNINMLESSQTTELNIFDERYIVNKQNYMVCENPWIGHGSSTIRTIIITATADY